MRSPIQALAVAAIAALMGCLMIPATAAADPFITAKLGTTVCNGTVMSMNSTHMIIGCRHRGKTAQLDFVLNDVTVRKGEIAVGSDVTVHYRAEKTRNLATSIQLRKALMDRSPP